MDQKELDLKEFFQITWKWKNKIIRFVFIVTTISIGISLLLPKWYRSQAIILSPQSSSSFNAMSLLGELGIGSVMGSNENSFRYLAILKSRSLRMDVIDKFDLKNHYKSKNTETALEVFDKNLHFEIGDEFQIVIAMIDKDQDLVAPMTNYIVSSLDSLNIELSVLNAKNNRIFMGKRFEEISDSLETASKRLEKYMEQHGILSLENQVIAGVEQASLLKAAIIQKEVEFKVAKQTFSQNSPIISQLQIELNSLQIKYDDLINSDLYDSLVPKFSEVPSLQLNILKLQSEVEYYGKILEYLGPLYEQQKIEEAKNIPTIQVLDEAVRPELKNKPKRSRIVIITFLIATIAAVIFYYIKEEK